MTAWLYLPRLSPRPANAPPVPFESATAEVIARRKSKIERSTLYVLAALVGSFVIFILVFPLDRIVTAPGKVVPIEGTLLVQPLNEAIVRSINVRIGDVVKKGQVLATLDPTFAAADLATLQQKVASLKAETRRIDAEEANVPFVAASAAPYEILQANNWRQRQDQYNAGLDNIEESIKRDEATIVKLQQDISGYDARSKIAAEVEKMRHSMEVKGWESHLVRLGATDTRVELERLLADSQNGLTAAQHDLASLRAQRTNYIQSWHTANLATLVLRRNDLDQALDDLSKAERLRELTHLVAPEDAIITNVTKLSATGAVLDPAKPLFTLVPLDAPLEVDVQIAAHDVGFPQVGDPVSLKFEAYKFLEHGEGEGKVKTISHDSFTINPDGTPAAAPYFDARIEIVAVHLHDVPADFRVIPGMTVQADIVVGQRTIAWYIFGSAMKTGAEAMHEP